MHILIVEDDDVAREYLAKALRANLKRRKAPKRAAAASSSRKTARR